MEIEKFWLLAFVTMIFIVNIMADENREASVPQKYFHDGDMRNIKGSHTIHDHLVLKVYLNAEKQHYDCIRFKGLPRLLQQTIKKYPFLDGFDNIRYEDFPEELKTVVNIYYPYPKELSEEFIFERIFCTFPNYDAVEA